MTLNNDDILKHRGGTAQNDFTNTINLEHFEMSNQNKSKYYDTDGLKTFLNKHKNKLTILSLNIDSLYSKFEYLKQLTETLEQDGAPISIICIQEARIHEQSDTNHLQLHNYNLTTQCLNKHCSTKGGLAIYTLNNIHITNIQQLNTFNTWEGLSIRIE
jgi:hypothetical protein